MMSCKGSNNTKAHRAMGKIHSNRNSPSTHMWPSKQSNSSGVIIKNSRSESHEKQENIQHFILLKDQKPYQDKMQEGSIQYTNNTCVRNKIFQHRIGQKRVFRLIVKYFSRMLLLTARFQIFSRSVFY